MRILLYLLQTIIENNKNLHECHQALAYVSNVTKHTEEIQ